MSVEGSEHVVQGRGSALVLIITSVLMVAFMAIHPTLQSHELHDVVTGLSRVAVFNGFVHGTLCALAVLSIVGYWGLSERLGLGWTLVRAGLAFYAFSIVAGVLAGTINGFVITALAKSYKQVPPEKWEAVRPLLVLCHEANAALARMDVVGGSLAIFAWSIALAHRSGSARWLGWMGLVIGVAPVAALALGKLPMTVHGFGAFVVLQAVWGVMAGVHMLRGRL